MKSSLKISYCCIPPSRKHHFRLPQLPGSAITTKRPGMATARAADLCLMLQRENPQRIPSARAAVLEVQRGHILHLDTPYLQAYATDTADAAYHLLYHSSGTSLALILNLYLSIMSQTLSRYSPTLIGHYIVDMPPASDPLDSSPVLEHTVYSGRQIIPLSRHCKLRPPKEALGLSCAPPSSMTDDLNLDPSPGLLSHGSTNLSVSPFYTTYVLWHSVPPHARRI